MQRYDLEQECQVLRARVFELEAQLSAHTKEVSPENGAHTYTNGHSTYTNGHSTYTNGHAGPSSTDLKLSGVLRALLDHLEIAVWAIDSGGIFTFQDGKGLKRAGLVASQFVGKSIFSLYGDDGSTVECIHAALAGKSKQGVTEAHGISWQTWYIPVHGSAGDVEQVVGLSFDITDSLQTKRELEAKIALVDRQHEVIQNLETPVIQVWDQVLTLPMVGVVDSRRAARVTDDLLNAVSRTQARFAILDLTGVDIVDTSTAAHMLNIITAVRLLGAEGIITGIRPNVAQTVVSLGLDLSRVKTLSTLRDGLAYAIRALGDRPDRPRSAMERGLRSD